MKRKRINWDELSSSSSSSRISTRSIELLIERLMNKQTRDSTTRTYLSIWRQFNKFLITLDILPSAWEDRATLFLGFIIGNGVQSATVKTYLSAIKKLATLDNYKWDDSKVLISSLTKACRLLNGKVYTHLPISCSLLEFMLFELE